jgi:hypothetical protein
MRKKLKRKRNRTAYLKRDIIRERTSKKNICKQNKAPNEGIKASEQKRTWAEPIYLIVRAE